ncbi:hypothetical protein [Arenimonas daejeonensis]|uniref:hypothetical protein n=1 Tax=Arenimonas daejeonensis TaxID=370777 RepID=UPI001D133F8E|nr:hypothetical protein [Arenimonas daejeonensis]
MVSVTCWSRASDHPSLRWRLLLGATGAILLALGVAWVFMTLLFERHLERRLEDELVRDALALVADLSLSATGTAVIEGGLSDPRLQTPAGGVYWQVSTPSGELRSRSLWDAALPVTMDVPGDDWRLRHIDGPFDQTLAVVERRLSWIRIRPRSSCSWRRIPGRCARHARNSDARSRLSLRSSGWCCRPRPGCRWRWACVRSAACAANWPRCAPVRASACPKPACAKCSRWWTRSMPWPMRANRISNAHAAAPPTWRMA